MSVHYHPTGCNHGSCRYTSFVLHLGTQVLLVASKEIPIAEVSSLADTRVMIFKTVTVAQKTACLETWFCGLLPAFSALLIFAKKIWTSVPAVLGWGFSLLS